MSPAVKRFWTLTELNKRSGLSVHVIKRTFADLDVPIFGEGKARGVLLKDLRPLLAMRPEILRAFDLGELPAPGDEDLDDEAA